MYFTEAAFKTSMCYNNSIFAIMQTLFLPHYPSLPGRPDVRIKKRWRLLIVATVNKHNPVIKPEKTRIPAHSAVSGNIHLLCRYVYFHIRYIRSNLDGQFNYRTIYRPKHYFAFISST